MEKQMSTPLIGMTLKEACDAVQAYADIQGLPFLEALQSMEADYDELDLVDRTAYGMVMRAGQEMFMADGNEEVS